jgi:hypothetical protein
MPAWEIKKLWSAKEIGEYRDYAAAEGVRKSGVARCTCEDLSIRLVTEYASANGLPVMFANGAYPAGLSPLTHKNVTEFVNKVLTSTGARDLSNYGTAVMVAGTAKSDATSLRQATKGDLILLYDPVGHVQVVVSASSSVVKIVQGNTYNPWGFNSSDPTHENYVGEIVAEKSHVLEASSGKWIYEGSREVFKNDHGRLMIWDFDAWNRIVVERTVKQGETLKQIAKELFGQESLWTVIYDTNATALGPNMSNFKAGMKLYILKK